MLHPMEHDVFVEPRLVLDGVHRTRRMLGQLTPVNRPSLHTLVDDEWLEHLSRCCHSDCDSAALALFCTLAHVHGSLAANIDGRFGGRTIELVRLVHVNCEFGVARMTNTHGNYQLQVGPSILAGSLRRLL